jgi:hypothetical protein
MTPHGTDVPVRHYPHEEQPERVAEPLRELFAREPRP